MFLIALLSNALWDKQPSAGSTPYSVFVFSFSSLFWFLGRALD